MKMTMAKKLISKVAAHAPTYVAALAGLALMLVAGNNAQAFSLSQVGPNYGCLLNPFPDSQVMQLKSDKKGNFTAGSMVINFSGEACFFTLSTGTYTVNKDNGTGTIVLNWTSTTSTLSDSDDSGFCAATFGSIFTEHFASVLEKSGMHLDLLSLDPAFSGSGFTGTDPGDRVQFGSCTKQ